MNENYPIPAETLLQTLDELFSHLGQDRIAALLREADVSIEWEEHDNWNGGIEYYAFNLKVPVATFASVDVKRGHHRKTPATEGGRCYPPV
jgi:hypothetical protein